MALLHYFHFYNWEKLLSLLTFIIFLLLKFLLQIYLETASTFKLALFY